MSTLQLVELQRQQQNAMVEAERSKLLREAAAARKSAAAAWLSESLQMGGNFKGGTSSGTTLSGTTLSGPTRSGQSGLLSLTSHEATTPNPDPSITKLSLMESVLFECV